MLIRSEEGGDAGEIGRVVEAAFGQTLEARLVDELRRDGDVVFSLVAEDGGSIAGHVLLSPLRASIRALALAPLSVRPDRQREGIGSALVRAAIEAAGRDDWGAIFLLGEPGYYRRFGFSVEAARGFASPYAGPYFQMLPLRDDPIAASGAVHYPVAFSRL